MSNQMNIFLGIIALILIGHSWWIHYQVKDGIAKLMLLWGCGLLFAFILMRTIGFVLADLGILDIYALKLWNTYNILPIYAIVIGQQYIQRNRGEREEDDQMQKDKKELKKLRKG